MKSKLQVMKFGGTSVGDASCIARAAQIVARAAGENGVVAVVSAMTGVTNPWTLERNVRDKLFGSCVDHTHCPSRGRSQVRCPLRGVREVVAVGLGIVPDLVGVPHFGNSLLIPAGSSVHSNAANGAACRHQTPVWPGGQAAERKVEYSAFAFHGKAHDRIREPVGIEHVNTIFGPRHILVKPPSLPIPNRLFQTVLFRRILVVTQHRSIGSGDEGQKRRCISITGGHEDFVRRVISQFVNSKLAPGWDPANGGRTRLRRVRFNDVAGAISSPHVAEAVRYNSIWPGRNVGAGFCGGSNS